MTYRLWRCCCAEGLGTFALVFAGTGAIVVDSLSGQVTHVGIALTFGLVVFAIIAALGDVSGAHINPAVTLGFVAAGRFPLRWAFFYLLAQFLGATLASVVIQELWSGSPTWGETIPRDSSTQAWVMEFILTAGLMFVILNVSTGAKEKGITAGMAIGSVVAVEALVGGPVSGASMNPARSFGPAVVSLNCQHLWIYLTAPVIGALLAVICCGIIRGRSCCTGDDERVEPMPMSVTTKSS
jgi:aquaporin Z